MDKATENYIPYGPEWEKEMMKQKKEYLIAMIRRIKTGSDTNIDLEKLAQKEWDNFCPLNLPMHPHFLAGYKAASITNKK